MEIGKIRSNPDLEVSIRSLCPSTHIEAPGRESESRFETSKGVNYASKA